MKKILSLVNNMSVNGVQSLKSATQTRVRTDLAQRLASQRQNLGEGSMGGAMCDLRNDQYGRPVGQDTLLLNDPACSHYNSQSAQRRMNLEVIATRPQFLIGPIGYRGASDAMGMGRDKMPRNLYGSGNEGDFVRVYNTPNNAPPQPLAPCDAGVAYYQRRIQPWSGSMDATDKRLYL